MKLPFMNYQSRSVQRQIGTLGGYNRRIIISENEFYDMKNMSSDDFPAIRTRKPRGKAIKALTKPNGLFYKNGLLYVDGTGVFYKDKQVGTVVDSLKQMVGMGAYVLIWPDKVCYNTHTNEFTQMEKSYVQSGPATFAPVTKNSPFTKITVPGINFSKFDGVTIEGCTNPELNKTTVVQESGTDYIVITAALEAEFTQPSGLKITRKVPDMDFVCESNNRIWGCSSAKHEIYASKLGDPMNWNNFEQISTDSYAATVGSDGDFTGCIGHLGNVLFFKENTIHKIYGNKPANFQINTYSLPGVARNSAGSICIINETLYYKGRKGVYSYDGSVPTFLSDAFGEEMYHTAHAEQYKEKYYISLKSGANTALMVYDPKLQMWHKEDDTEIKMAAFGEGELYYVDKENQIRTIEDETAEETIDWMLESGDMMENTFNSKHILKLMFHVKLDYGAVMEVYLKYDSEPMWQRVFALKNAKKKTYVIPIIPRRCSQFKYKIEGYGNFRLFGISKNVEKGSEING